MNYESLQFSEGLQGVLKEMGLVDVRETIMFLEQYMYYSRGDLTEFLHSQFSDTSFVAVEDVNRDASFATIESKYNVIISRVDANSVEVIYDYFTVRNLDTIELETQFNMVKMIPLAVTPMNFCEIAGISLPEFDPLEVFKRYLIEALRLHATDMHFDVKHCSEGTIYPVEFRISGDLLECKLIPLTQSLNMRIISSLVAKETTSNEIDLLEASGVVSSAPGVLGSQVELRISANKVLDGYHYVLRLQQKTTTSMKIEQLGFAPAIVNALHRVARKKSGITFITGAVRTGKNTTAFAMANEMVKEPIKIISYESPIEVLMPFTQVDYQGEASILLDCVRLAKKQDVDVAFLNEIPDKNVAFAVQDLVNSSVHVITTMHMDRVWHLPYKLREYYGDQYKDVISQINIVMNQKMFPKVCPVCRDKILVDTIEEDFIRDYLKENGMTYVYTNHGCASCQHTGHIIGSNQPFAEFVLFNDDLISKLLACDSPTAMELILKKAATENRLEKYMLGAIERGDLAYSALESVL